MSGLCILVGLVLQAPAAITATILAGGETDLPADTPSGRLDTVGEFSFVGAQAFTCSGFTGFANPSVNDDLALLHLAVPLPVGMGFPTI